MPQLNAGTVFNPKMGGDSKGVLMVDYSSAVTLYGSLNGQTFIKIKTSTSDALEEVVLAPHMAFSVDTDDKVTSLSSAASATKVYINETR